MPMAVFIEHRPEPGEHAGRIIPVAWITVPAGSASAAAIARHRRILPRPVRVVLAHPSGAIAIFTLRLFDHYFAVL